jgi:signal transduction histidine kinase
LLYVTLLTATHPAVTHVNLRRLVDRTVQQWEDSLRTSSEATQPSIDGSPNAAFRQIHYQLDGGGKAPFLIRGVEEWLERAFLNLLDNAFRFTRDGDAITVTLRQRGDEFHIAVADTGYGMEPDQLSAIFEPFATGAGAGRFGQPRLNLPISRKVAELHNGDLRVESVPGQGSTFTLILPVV